MKDSRQNGPIYRPVQTFLVAENLRPGPVLLSFGTKFGLPSPVLMAVQGMKENALKLLRQKLQLKEKKETKALKTSASFAGKEKELEDFT